MKWVRKARDTLQELRKVTVNHQGNIGNLSKVTLEPQGGSFFSSKTPIASIRALVDPCFPGAEVAISTILQGSSSMITMKMDNQMTR